MSTITSIAKKLGISVSSIRYYERNGLLEPHRKENNYREYSDEDEKRVKLIIVMKYAGFSIKEMKELISLNDYQVLEEDCIKETESKISDKKIDLLGRIERYKDIINLIDVVKPFAISSVTPESQVELDAQVDLIFNKSIKGG